MNEPECEFASLMARVRLHDNQALAALITLYEPTIQRAARVLLGKAMRSEIDPTDLVQSVHLQLILGLKRKNFAVDSPEQLRGLAVTLLRNKFIEHWRRRRCLARLGLSVAMTSARADANTAAVHGDLDPARAAEYKDSIDHLYRQLRAQDRTLIVMRLEGYRSEEIAKELGIGPAVLRVRLSRLRERLRKAKTMTKSDRN
jgi:RNA polymerase sigma-70 factor, ECF subfamily